MKKKDISSIVKEELDKIFCDRRKGVCPITESGVNRILKHGENGMIIISGNRSSIVSDNPEISLEYEFSEYLQNNNIKPTINVADKWLKDRNKKADNEIKNILKNSKFSYSQVYGGYHGQDGVADDFEPSFIVYARDKSGGYIPFSEVLELGLNLCLKYKQDSFYVQEPGKDPIYMNYKGEKVNSTESKKFKINRDSVIYYTTTKRDRSNPKKITADIVFENKVYCAVRPSTYTEKIMRASRGEYFIDVD